METKIIEAGQTRLGPNWGKFLVGRFTQEFTRKTAIDSGNDDDAVVVSRIPLLMQRGWTYSSLLVLDLETGEGAVFRHGGLARADLNDRHQIWVCPMFEPFLEWLYKQDVTDLQALPDFVELPDAPADLYGYRRQRKA